MTMLAVHAIITDTCRTNRTNLGALDEAFQRIRNEYLILSEIHKIGSGVNLHVKLEVEMPPTRKPEDAGGVQIAVLKITHTRRALRRI